ncbi:MAG: hypothetical protein Q7R87_04005 [Nanoarchaeota archaeon]|nr:hypothetical protein [Nanoarchaeota archaeon]
MKIEVNLKKRYFIFILASALLLGSMIAVYAYGTNNPAIFGHSPGELEGGGVPSGAIVMFDTVCPTGWTRFTGLDGKVAKGSATYGATGGADTHVHDVSVSRTNADKSWRTPIQDISILPSSSWPPYLEVVWCKKD